MHSVSGATSASKSSGTVALDLLRLFTTKGYRYACLNGHQGLPQVVPSDLDVVVDERDFGAVFDTAIDHFADHGFQLATALWYDVPRCWALVFVGGPEDFIQIDLESDNRGIGRLGRSRYDCLKRSELVESIRVADEISRAAYIVRKRQYKAITAEREQTSYKAALDTLGIEAGTKWYTRPQFRRLHMRARIGDWTNSSFHWPAWALWRARRASWRISVPTGIVVGFIGPDGSGKTTTYTRLAELTRQSYQRTRVIHVRPGRVLPIKQHGAGGRAPDRAQGKSFAKAMAKLALMWLDIQTLRWDFARARRTKTMVVWDRGAHDILLDPKRHGVEGIPLLLRRAMVASTPRADLVIACVGDSEVFHRRKPELPEEDVREQVRRIEDLRDVVRLQTDGKPVNGNELSSLVLPTPAARRATSRFR